MSLVLNNISKSFENKKILENFSYEFPKSGIFAITGDSGIGKTTLLRMIAGLDKKYSGTIIGAGAQNSSFAFQEYRLFPKLTAYENVAFASFKKATQEEKNLVENLIMELGFTKEELNLLPSELSGGMKQRISLARAFLKKSPILLLDEPTKEIDSELRTKVLSMIKDESKYRLVLIVTHNPDDISYLNAIQIPL